MRACKQCGETIPDGHKGAWCARACYGRWHYEHNRDKYIAKSAAAKAPCIDCGTPRDKYSKGGRCNPCNGRARRGKPLKTGKTVTTGGYVLLTGKHEHPNAYRNGTVLEHVYVMSQHLGRAIRPGENIHHINGDKADNRLANLELWSTSQPKGQRVADKVAWARQILAMYADEVDTHSRAGIVRAL